MALQIQYKDYFVAYVDALGFSNLVMISPDQDKARKQIEAFYTECQKAFARINKIPTKQEIYAVVMSDTIVMAIPATAVNENRIDSLRELCIAIRDIQRDMALRGFWLRGGIALGKCWIDRENNKIVGPAFLRAHHLENKVALFPRVILDAEIIPKLGFKNKTELITEINRAISSNVCLFDWNRADQTSSALGNETKNLIDEDHPLFIDYLYKVSTNSQRKRMKQIMQKIEENIYSELGFTKLRWVANYLATLYRCNRAMPEMDEDYQRLKNL